MAPLIVAVMPIGLVFGAVAASKGLSSLEVTLMSAFVFAGGSQFVAMDIWSHPASWGALGFSALLVNIRHVLMSASIGTKMPAFSGPAKYAAMLLLADEIWAMAETRATQARLSAAWYAGLAVPFYFVWVLTSLAGSLAGAFLGDPKVIGLDFAFPAVFVVLLMGFWKGRETGAVLAASAAAAVLTHQLLPGVWYIAAGAAAGVIATLVIDQRREACA
ncbi:MULTISPECIES: AzlC family ABC transporter permease [unclassified Sinorhizobium]|uniref:AzlC family ABC transporter permease n=1 Tax=unclassified Sinorhizobium TaxID=2613772 RepID=UPI0024C30CE6|nr:MULTISPECIES: AzlC family ABC transporter permease [unclassified Sinorhizobium]MDK1375479.1 AzlC family ABC transporter permease [Sinorhizobium sp. 6-70]MDK1478169.1 AzlC family ABC transporter permease [Sinorhizobium sp. 6-117]